MLIQNTSGGQNYSQWTWPKWVVPYRLRRFSHQFEHPKSTPYLSCKTFQRFKQGRAVSAATCSTTSAYSPAFSLAQRWQQSSAWGNYGIEHVQYVSTICGCPLAIDTINQIQKKQNSPWSSCCLPKLASSKAQHLFGLLWNLPETFDKATKAEQAEPSCIGSLQSSCCLLPEALLRKRDTAWRRMAVRLGTNWGYLLVISTGCQKKKNN